MEIWENVLDLRPIGVQDNFFDLGGHSLAASQIVSRVFQQFQLQIPLQALFQSATVAAMAAVIAEHQEEIDQLRKEWAAIRKQYESKIKAFSKKVVSLIEHVSEELEINAPDLDLFPIPEATEADETEQALYDSSPNYFEQLAAYKEFQGHDADESDEDE